MVTVAWNRVQSLIIGLFDAWRRLVTRVISSAVHAGMLVRQAGQRWWAGCADVRDYLMDTRRMWAEESSDVLTPIAAFGLRAFVAGLIISSAVAVGTGSFLSTALLAGLIETLWAAARLMIVLLMMPVSVPRSRVLIAFAAGLAPYAIAVTPLVRLVALGLSAILTQRGLSGAGAAPKRARTAVGWAFGGQLVIVIAGVIVRSAVALLAGS